jgi:hypothetical protein
MRIIRYLFEPAWVTKPRPPRVTLTWKDGHVSRYEGLASVAIILFFMPSFLIDLLRGTAELRDTDRTVEIVWPS